ncbi:uncharacterized protein LOC133302292 [Gastrolobium bilobum]|uniref:uncharacterized protein LOC133302292 n=1 Tax=Gastrolobium bilobum TaxID=150636 RepID=UPI002AB03182|nr:uncharacterized protein LOC133302292 [Gastrolobium bilobum]
MAEGTCSTVKRNMMEECVTKLARHEEQFNAFGELLQSMNLKLTLMEAKLDQNQKSKVEHKGGSSNESGLNTFLGNNAYKSVKFSVPRFAGGNPEPWIHKIQQFYGFRNLSDGDKLTLTSFQMDGVAENWFHWMERSQRLSTWGAFVIALRSRFGPSKYRDLRGELGRLTQHASVEEFQKEFEQLSNLIIGIDDVTLQSYFENGLKSEIRKEVRMHLPDSLQNAIELAKVVEDKFNDRIPARSGYQRNFTNNQTTKQQPGLLPTPNKGTVNTTGTSKDILPIKRLSAAEMMEKREKGLCYYCDDKFHRNHVCKGKMFLLLIQENEEEEKDEVIEATNETIGGEDDIPGISLHAMDGQYSSSTLRLKGLINKHSVQVLVDEGSTHNFVQERIVKFLGLEVQPIGQFKVMVGNEASLGCKGVCRRVGLELQGYKFCPDLFVLPIQDAEVVLGVQWLSEFGDVTTNYKQLVLKFEREGRVIELKGETKVQVEPIELHQLRRLSNSDAVATYFQLQTIDHQHSIEPYIEEACHSLIQPVLQEYEDIFATPNQLPPSRLEDHRIYLEPGTKAVNVRPYRYPYFQKTEIEKMVKEMLNTGVIRPSLSPFLITSSVSKEEGWNLEILCRL